MQTPQTLYDVDLAYIHDVGFSGLSEGWAPGLLELLREAGIDAGTVVDFGCGGGGWIQRLVDAGYRAVGLDVSAAMIERARRRVPSAEFHIGSVWEFAVPKCRAVTALSEVLCYRSDAGEEPRLETLFERIFLALEPGGLFIFDVTGVGLDRDRDRTFSEGDDWACLVRYEYDEAQARLHRHITTFRQVDTLYRRTQERHTVQLYEADDVADTLKSIGYHVQRVSKFGTASLLPMRAGFVATKPA